MTPWEYFKRWLAVGAAYWSIADLPTIVLLGLILGALRAVAAELDAIRILLTAAH